jgi:hypothetical protein
MNIRIPSEELAEWRDTAARNNMTLSDFVRLAVNGFLFEAVDGLEKKRRYWKRIETIESLSPQRRRFKHEEMQLQEA